MNLRVPDLDFRVPEGLINLKVSCISIGVMNSRVRRTSSPVEGKGGDYRQSVLQGNNRRPFSSSYFSVESLVVLVCLTASLLILPLILPPLPPPPFMLLLVPIGILAVLMILACMPSDVRNIASPYV